MKRFLLWLGLATLAIALILPFVLGRLLADAYPTLLQQTLGRAAGPARLDRLDFRAGWFGSEAHWLVKLPAGVLEVDDHIRHFPLQAKAVLDGLLRPRGLPLELRYSLGLDQRVRLQGELQPGRQGLAYWESGRLQANLQPDGTQGRFEGWLDLLLLPAVQIRQLHLAGRWQIDHWQLATALGTLAFGQTEWQELTLGLQGRPQTLQLKLQAESLQRATGQCRHIQAQGRLIPAEPGYWLQLAPLLGRMEQLDWLRFATETLPGLLAANPVVEIEHFRLQCGKWQPVEGRLTLQLLNMPPQQVLQPEAWLSHLDGEGWLQADPNDLQALGLPSHIAGDGRLELHFSSGLVRIAGQTFPLTMLIQGAQP